MNYKLHFPDDYVKPKLPLRDVWIADLRNPPANVIQGNTYLQKEINNFLSCCCLGRLCSLQGRLVPVNRLKLGVWKDGSEDVDSDTALSELNPLYPILKGSGVFPPGVRVEVGGGYAGYRTLSMLNDIGITFTQIADIIEAVWDNGEETT